ncbi:MAG: UDP-N-acetylmuramoyl-L-alanine--D-glutamate ligase [Phycisphaerales bacterium]|nr:MAG: UDP-N-acetylmuramoyl-L-alanine--D-glutamate ligase [Phycisphaerales bacterium]
MDRQFFSGKTVLVMGLGRFGGGADAARFACDAGAKVIVTDLSPPEKLRDSIDALGASGAIVLHLGGHDPADFERADIIITNPAIPPDNQLLRAARKNKKVMTSQIEIFFELCPAATIGITGANGKSTTAALTAHLLQSAIGAGGIDYSGVRLSGNIGNRPLLGLLDEIHSHDLVVLELSSFQLEQLARIEKAPKVALLTNLTPNHLDRHGTFEAYCAAKENIFRLQRLDENDPAVSIFNAEDPVACRWFEKYKGDPGRICLKFSPDDLGSDILSAFALPGRANISNLAAAAAVAHHFGLSDRVIARCLPDFKALPHRLELVAEIDGVRWYNDSIATTPQSTIAALEALDRPKILIAGGYDKNLPFEQLGRKIAASAKAAVLIGSTAAKIADAINDCPDNRARIELAPSLAEAVALARKIAGPGDVVMLSPACASYDMFDNFQQRGACFVELVKSLSP